MNQDATKEQELDDLNSKQGEQEEKIDRPKTPLEGETRHTSEEEGESSESKEPKDQIQNLSDADSIDSYALLRLLIEKTPIKPNSKDEGLECHPSNQRTSQGKDKLETQDPLGPLKQGCSKNQSQSLSDAKSLDTNAPVGFLRTCTSDRPKAKCES